MASLRRVAALATALALGLAGCVLAPRGTREERLRAERAGAAWTVARPPRHAPPLGDAPTWQDLLRHALHANGALEASYHEWRAALARLDVAAAYPNTNVSLDWEYVFSGDGLKGWDRNNVRLGFDPMQNLSFPTKIVAAGRVALADAQAAGERFVAMKLALQRDVLTAWYDYALTAETQRLAEEQAALAALAGDVALAGVTAGGEQTGAVASLSAAARSDDRVQTLTAALLERRSRLNALLGRAPDAPLPPPAVLPTPRPVPDDAALLAAGIRNDPEVAALAREREARSLAVDAARQEFIPDVNPFVGFEGGMAQIVGLAVSLPARVTMIRAAIIEARTMEARAQALEAQGARDRLAEFLGTLAMLRAAERRTALYETRVVPLATQLAASARAAYEAGALDLSMLLDAEDGAIEARAMAAEARVERERQLATLEALGGFDAETLTPARAEEAPQS